MQSASKTVSTSLKPHKMPRALLGGNERSNLVASCVSCNMQKKDKTDAEFIAQKGAA
mgnify:CR=1 FL=1